MARNPFAKYSPLVNRITGEYPTLTFQTLGYWKSKINLWFDRYIRIGRHIKSTLFPLENSTFFLLQKDISQKNAQKISHKLLIFHYFIRFLLLLAFILSITDYFLQRCTWKGNLLHRKLRNTAAKSLQHMKM